MIQLKIQQFIALLGVKRRGDVVQVDYLVPDLLSVSVQSMKFYVSLPTLLNVVLSFNTEVYPLILWWSQLSALATLFDVAFLIFGVAFLALYVALR